MSNVTIEHKPNIQSYFTMPHSYNTTINCNFFGVFILLFSSYLSADPHLDKMTSPSGKVFQQHKKKSFKIQNISKRAEQEQVTQGLAATNNVPLAEKPITILASPSQKDDVPESRAKTPGQDKKDTQAPEYANDRPRQSLGATESQRVDQLSGKAAWENKENFRIHDLFRLPGWVDLSLEERLRLEDYSTPWRGGKPGTVSDTGQYSLPLETVIYTEARFTDRFRAGFEFWDARQWGGPNQTDPGGTPVHKNYPDSITNSTVNSGQFAQIYAAYIERNLFQDIDSETKAGQMTMNIGSNRLIGRAAYRNTQQQYVGIQQRFREKNGDWELLSFANIPEWLMPGINASGTVNTYQLEGNNTIWNRPETNSYFTGALFTKDLFAKTKGELYLYYLNEGPQTVTNRRLFTPGFRIFSPNRKGEINYEFETIGQTGTALVKTSTANSYQNYSGTGAFWQNQFGAQASANTGWLPSQKVGAMYQHIHIGYTFNTDFDPRLTAQWDYGSSHFDTLYGPTVFEFGPTGIGGFFSTRTNINSPGWKFEFIPHRDVTVYLNQRWWWMADAYSTSGWGGAGILNAVNGGNYQGSYIGETIELNARWDAHSNIAFQAGWQILMKGDLAIYGTGAPGENWTVGKTTGQATHSETTGNYGAPNGSNVNYFYVQTQIRM